MSRPHISSDLRRRVAEPSRHRCGYCLSAEAIVGAAMELDHITPVTLGGQSVEDNLWLACSPCNDHKNDRVAYRTPRRARSRDCSTPGAKTGPPISPGTTPGPTSSA